MSAVYNNLEAAREQACKVTNSWTKHGSVIVSGGKILASGYNTIGTHAEISAINNYNHLHRLPKQQNNYYKKSQGFLKRSGSLRGEIE